MCRGDYTCEIKNNELFFLRLAIIQSFCATEYFVLKDPKHQEAVGDVFSAVKKWHRIFCYKEEKAYRKHICHVAIAYPFIGSTDKFHYLQQFRLIFSLFCFVLQF
jgi:hypothetical protein